jgi:hypothetical protein
MKTTPRILARLAGALYLISAVPAGFSIYVLQKLFVRGDAAATAKNILGSESLFRLGFVADLAGIMFVLGSLVFLFDLFQPVSRSLARLMVFFCLMGSAIQALNSLQDLTALVLLKGGAGLTALTTEQAQALAFLFLRLHTLTYDLALAFYAVFALMIGALVLKSTFLPRVLGVLTTIDGLSYLTFSLGLFLSPPFAVRLQQLGVPLVTALLGEMLLMLWLIVKGVKAQRWEEQAAAAAGPGAGPLPVVLETSSTR